MSAPCFGARLCEPQQRGQPERNRIKLKPLEYSPLLRVTDPRSGSFRAGVGFHLFDNVLASPELAKARPGRLYYQGREMA
jgi:hypothetical protein